jgi:hypothetical protein
MSRVGKAFVAVGGDSPAVHQLPSGLFKRVTGSGVSTEVEQGARRLRLCRAMSAAAAGSGRVFRVPQACMRRDRWRV